MTMKYRELVVWSAFLLVSFFSSVCLFIFNSSSDKYAYIGFLPLVFFLCSACFANVYKVLGKNIGVLCLHSVMAIRLVVTPVLMSISGDSSIFRGILADDVNYAIALLCYECVLVYVVLSYMASKSIKRIKLAEREYAVEPVGVATIKPSAR